MRILQGAINDRGRRSKPVPRAFSDARRAFPSAAETVRKPGVPRRVHASIALAFLGILALAAAHAALSVDEETRQILVEAVETAVTLDLYNARCRSDISGRRSENLNRLLVNKIKTTLLTVQDDLFPEGSYRRVQQRLEEDFIETLREAGGCQGAKDSGLREQLKERYDSLLDAIRALP